MTTAQHPTLNEKQPKDPLLTAGKFMTTIMQIIIGFSMFILTIVLPILLFNSEKFAQELARVGAEINATSFWALTCFLLAATIAVLVGAIYFFRLLGQIIDTVKHGEALSITNAQRLSKMGWIALIFQAVSIPIQQGTDYLSSLFPDQSGEIGIQFSLTGILLAITLFILARVFRRGAQMREELEGTI